MIFLNSLVIFLPQRQQHESTPASKISEGFAFASSNNLILAVLRPRICEKFKMVNPSWILSAALAAASAVTGLATQRRADALKNAPPGISYKIPKATHPWSSSSAKITKASQHVQQLRPVQAGRATRFNPKSAAAILGAHQRLVGGFGYENVTTTSAYGTQYAVEALFNGHQMSLLIDTGSSDTWAVQRDFHCVDYSGEFLPQETCGFGATYPETFQYGFTDPETHMFIQYGDGEIVTGPMGFSDVSIGNVTIARQQVCLANTTYWYGNNYTSGLLGLAFPALTNAYLGEESDHDFGNAVQYSPLFTSMVNQGLVDPVFSIAIDRNASTGMLAFGGIAPASGLDLTRTATLDMVIVGFHFSNAIHELLPTTNMMADQRDRNSRDRLPVLLLHDHSGRLALRPDHEYQEDPVHC